jgi:hypothetical protein
VVKGSGGVRKIRWARQGGGKSGGVRVIYYNRLARGEVVLIFLYAKNEFESVAGEKLKELKNAIEKAYGRQSATSLGRFSRHGRRIEAID